MKIVPVAGLLIFVTTGWSDLPFDWSSQKQVWPKQITTQVAVTLTGPVGTANMPAGEELDVSGVDGDTVLVERGSFNGRVAMAQTDFVSKAKANQQALADAQFHQEVDDLLTEGKLFRQRVLAAPATDLLKEIRNISLPPSADRSQCESYVEQLYAGLDKIPNLETKEKYDFLYDKFLAIDPSQIEVLLTKADQGYYVPYEILDSMIKSHPENASLVWQHLRPNFFLYNRESSRKQHNWDLHPPNLLDLLLSYNLQEYPEKNIFRIFENYFIGDKREEHITTFKDTRWMAAMGRLGLYPDPTNQADLDLLRELMKESPARDAVFAYLYQPNSPLATDEAFNQSVLSEETGQCINPDQSYVATELISDLAMRGKVEALKFLLQQPTMTADKVPRFQLVSLFYFSDNPSNNMIFVEIPSHKQPASMEKNLAAASLSYRRVQDDAQEVVVPDRVLENSKDNSLFYQPDFQDNQPSDALDWLETNKDKIGFQTLQLPDPLLTKIGVYFLKDNKTWKTRMGTLQNRLSNAADIQGKPLFERGKDRSYLNWLKQFTDAWHQEKPAPSPDEYLSFEKTHMKAHHEEWLKSLEPCINQGLRQATFWALVDSPAVSDPRLLIHFMNAPVVEEMGINHDIRTALLEEHLGPEHTQLAAEYFAVAADLRGMDPAVTFPSWARVFPPVVASYLKYLPTRRFDENDLKLTSHCPSPLVAQELSRIFYEGIYQSKINLSPVKLYEYLKNQDSLDLRALVAEVILASPSSYKNDEPINDSLIKEAEKIKGNNTIPDDQWKMQGWKSDQEYSNLIKIAALSGIKSALDVLKDSSFNEAQSNNPDTQELVRALHADFAPPYAKKVKPELDDVVNFGTFLKENFKQLEWDPKNKYYDLTSSPN